MRCPTCGHTSDAWTEDDAAKCRAILDAGDDATRARLIHEYWTDIHRAERTPRPILYLHLGIMVGAVEKLTSFIRGGPPWLDDGPPH